MGTDAQKIEVIGLQLSFVGNKILKLNDDVTVEPFLEVVLGLLALLLEQLEFFVYLGAISTSTKSLGSHS